MIKIKLNPNKVIVSRVADIGPKGKEYNVRWNVSKVGDPNYNYTVRFKSDIKKLIKQKGARYMNQ